MRTLKQNPDYHPMRAFKAKARLLSFRNV